MYYYKRTESQLWTVGCNDSNDEFIPESDHESKEEAAKRVAYLNGGKSNESESTNDLIKELLVEQRKANFVLNDIFTELQQIKRQTSI
jgi:hypothetical protein